MKSKIIIVFSFFILVLLTGCSSESEHSIDETTESFQITDPEKLKPNGEIDMYSLTHKEVETLCGKGNEEACYVMAMDYKLGRDEEENSPEIEIDDEKAISLYKMYCEKGNDRCCDGYVSYFLEDEANFYDPIKVKNGIDLACKVGAKYTCYHKAEYMIEGSNGFNKDIKTGTELTKEMCDKGTGEACKGYADILTNGNEIVKPNFEQAKEYYLKACALNESESCGKVAEFYRDGKGLPKDIKKSFEFAEKGCYLNGEELPCGILGDAYLNGIGVAENEEKALAAYAYGCLTDNSHCCKEAKKLSGGAEVDTVGLAKVLFKGTKKY